MKWYKDLYVGYNLLERKQEVVQKVIEGKIQFNIFVIALPENGYDTLEIYPSHVLTQNYYKMCEMMILGICYGKEEALDMMKLIIDDCMEETGSVDVRKYISDKMKEYENKEE